MTCIRSGSGSGPHEGTWGTALAVAPTGEDMSLGLGVGQAGQGCSTCRLMCGLPLEEGRSNRAGPKHITMACAGSQMGCSQVRLGLSHLLVCLKTRDGDGGTGKS